MIYYEEEDHKMNVAFDGEIDHHSCLEISRQIDDAIFKYTPKIIVFDFAKVSFMDSAGIGMLLGRYKKLIRFGSHAYMKNVRGDLMRIFSMSGIFKIIPIIEEEVVNG